MKLNELDARAVDMVLGGSAGQDGQDSDGAKTGPMGYPMGYITGGADLAGSASHNLLQRVTQVDDMLRLLDYLPADEPPATLVQKTMRRVQEARADGRGEARTTGARPGAAAGAGEIPGASEAYALHRSPNPRGEEDPSA